MQKRKLTETLPVLQRGVSGCTIAQDVLSNWGSPPRPGREIAESIGKPYNQSTWEMGLKGERVAERTVVLMITGNAGGGKGPHYFNNSFDNKESKG